MRLTPLATFGCVLCCKSLVQVKNSNIFKNIVGGRERRRVKGNNLNVPDFSLCKKLQNLNSSVDH